MHIMITLMDKMDILDMVGNVSKVMNIDQDGHDGHTEFIIMFIVHEHDGGDGYVPGNEPNQWRQQSRGLYVRNFCQATLMCHNPETLPQVAPSSADCKRMFIVQVQG